MNKKHVKSSEAFFKKLLKDPEVRMHYLEETARTEIAMAVFAARKKAHLTQMGLAKKAGTSQGVIARLEGGSDSRVPSMPLLANLTRACGGVFEFGFTFGKSTKPMARL